MNLTILAVLTILLIFLMAWFLLLPQGPGDNPWVYPELHRWDESHGH